MESEIRWDGCLGGQTAADTRGREHEAEAAARRCHAGQLCAEGSLGKEVVTPAEKRKAVAHLVEAREMSERRACKAIGCCRMTIRYQTTRADDGGIRQHMTAIAQQRRRFGYRRLHVLLKREGYVINHKRLCRLYREEKLTVRRPWGPQAGHWSQGSDTDSNGAQRSLVARLRFGSADLRPPLPHPNRRR